MKRAAFIICAILAVFSILPLGAEESFSLHLKLAGLKKAEAPEVFEDQLILSAQGPYRFVGAAFENENFSMIHPFYKNRQGVFVLAYPIPLKRQEPLAYRLVVDGAWIADPANPLKREMASAGVELSLAPIPYLSDEKAGLYQILDKDGRTAHFLLKARAGMLVTIEGSFCNWDPFLYEMAETSPGVYELEIVLPPGRQYYDFVYDGRSHADPLNVNKACTREGKSVSYLVVQ